MSQASGWPTLYLAHSRRQKLRYPNTRSARSYMAWQFPLRRFSGKNKDVSDLDSCLHIHLNAWRRLGFRSRMGGPVDWPDNRDSCSQRVQTSTAHGCIVGWLVGLLFLTIWLLPNRVRRIERLCV